MSEPLLYHSTRGANPAATISQAIAAGLAPDGGLYVPEALPRLDPSAFDPHGTLADTAARLLAPFFAGDALADELPAICAEALDFATPLRRLPQRDAWMLELFHGPTAAFKDVGARFLAACLRRLRRARAEPLTILVATSGDTGAAVAAAFHRQPGIRVAILYPDGRVSPRQAHQLGCFGVELWLSFIYASYNGALVVTLTEIMPAEVRTTGFSLAYSLATTLGGSSLAISQWLIHLTADKAAPGLWLSFAALCGLLATWIAFRDPRRRLQHLS